MLAQTGVRNPDFSKVIKRNQKSIARNCLYLKQGKRIHLQNICQNHYKFKNLFPDKDLHGF